MPCGGLTTGVRNRKPSPCRNVTLPSRGPRSFIEWENIQLAEQARCSGMLRNLCAADRRSSPGWRARAPAASRCCCCSTMKSARLRTWAKSWSRTSRAKSHCTLRLTAAPGLNYYEQKNRGAREAAAEIVVYLDSDVIPEDNWLISLLTPFPDSNVQVVSGNSYLTATGPYSKAFALFWFFPLPANTKCGLRAAPRFSSPNNRWRSAARRFSSIRSCPWAGTTRGWCLALHAIDCAGRGIVIYHNSAAGQPSGPFRPFAFRQSHSPKERARHVNGRIAQARGR